MLIENPEPSVTIIDTEAKAPGPTGQAVQAATLSAAAIRKPTGPPTEIRVVAPYRVCHEGNAYVGGDTATVPAEIADHWLKNKWAEPVPARTKPASQKGK